MGTDALFETQTHTHTHTHTHTRARARARRPETRKTKDKRPETRPWTRNASTDCVGSSNHCHRIVSIPSCCSLLLSVAAVAVAVAAVAAADVVLVLSLSLSFSATFRREGIRCAHGRVRRFAQKKKRGALSGPTINQGFYFLFNCPGIRETRSNPTRRRLMAKSKKQTIIQ